MKIITLTGPAASGKSHVAGIFAEVCHERKIIVHHIDTDKIVHELYASDTILALELASLFGSHILHFSMDIDRKALGNEVFGNPAKLTALGKIVHPKVMLACKETCEKLRKESKVGLVLCQIPQIHEVEKFGDSVIAVQTDINTRRARLISRGIIETRVEEIISSQPTDAEYAKLADHIIYNQAGDDLTMQVEKILERLG